MSGELQDFFAELPARAAEKDLSGVRATYVFSIEGGQSWTVRIEAGQVTVTPGIDTSADCTISASEETFARVLNSELGVMAAYMSGKVKVSGDLGAAMQLGKLLS
jgi:putative sterol carrier protein